MTGHLDTNTGAPGVFWRLSELAPGDDVILQTESGGVLTFKVFRVNSYSYEQAPLAAIFGPADQPFLNLVTCSGTWNTSKQTYDQRLVVYTVLDMVQAAKE